MLNNCNSESGFILDQTTTNMTALSHMCMDERNIIRAITITLNPRHHAILPDVMDRALRQKLRTYVTMRARIAYRFHSEFHESGVIHWHGTIVGSSTSVAKILACLRRDFGFVLSKTPRRLNQWHQYCVKEQGKAYRPITYSYLTKETPQPSMVEVKRSFNPHGHLPS